MSHDRSFLVHKFGGTSVANAERYRHVADILIGEETSGPRAVIVSAMGGVTDMLVGLVDDAAHRRDWQPGLTALQDKLFDTVDELLANDAAMDLRERFGRDLDDIQDLLRACALLRSASPETADLVSGFGELWSAQTLHRHLEARGVRAAWLDARDILVVAATAERAPRLLMDACQERLDGWMATHVSEQIEVLVITGFIASRPDGIPTTLGRNGSDYSAAIFSALLGAEALSIWTDVDGVMSANPRLVPDAVVLDALSYQEAMELAYFGAKVLHPSTIAPAIAKDVTITIKNTFAPEVPGTRIAAQGSSAFAIKGFTTIDDMALVNLEGTHMIGVPGIASRLFGALREAGVNVVMISQASSEHSICFAVEQRHVEAVERVIESAFFAERHQGQLQNLTVTAPCSILAVVGDQMAGQVGVAGRFLGALGRAQISVRAIAQGSSERNISVVIDQAEAQRALRAVHSAFYLSDETLSIGLIGTGVVGGELIRQLAAQAQTLREQFNVDLRVRAVATSEFMLLEEDAIELSTWSPDKLMGEQPTDLDVLAAHVDADHLPHAVIIDCTASAHVAAQYEGWLARGIHVITPNKLANTGAIEEYRALRAHRTRHLHYLYETTVGAGLPIIQTVRELIETGDEVLKIEGILSGTLSYLFNVWEGGAEQPFSSVVAEAKRLGYTEPDPRDDLSGMDVARKIVILAREIGLSLSLEDVTIEGLVPADLEAASVEDFLDALAAYDGEMNARLEAARADGQVLRFIGRVDHTGAARVALEAIPEDHPFARIQLTDNIVQFTTRRYAKNPLVVQGPGAGPEVTAGGVFADLLRLASYVGGAR